MENYSCASQDLEKCIELEANNAATLFERGKNKCLQGDFEGALQELNKANKLEPHNASTLRYCGMVKYGMKDYKVALENLDKSNELEPNNTTTLAERGQIKDALGDLAGALVDLNEADKIKPNDIFTLRNRAFVKGRSGAYEDALQDANAAYELDPHNIATLQCRAFVRQLLKDWQGAAHDIGKALELDPSNVKTLSRQACLKRATGDYHGALDVLNKVHTLYPSHIDILKARATMKHLLNDFQGSLQDLNKAHGLQPQDAFILKERVAVKVMTKDYQGALEDLNKVHQLDPDEFTRGLRKAVTQKSEEYLKAMGNSLQKVLHGKKSLMEKEIVGSYEDLSSQMSFLLEVTKIVLQMWTYCIVIVIFIFKYLMGYVERGQWGTYSNSSWEFRATYVCIELRLGAYPFQKFRDVPSIFPRHHTQNNQPIDNLPVGTSQSFQQQGHADNFTQGSPHAKCTKPWGIHYRCRKGKQGVLKYEPRVSLRVSSHSKAKRIYLGEYQTLREAVLIRDVAHFCLGKPRDLSVDPILLKDLAPIPQGQSPQEIRRLVLERAQCAKEFYPLGLQDFVADLSVEHGTELSRSNRQEFSHRGCNIGEPTSFELSQDFAEEFAGLAEFISVLQTPDNESLNLQATKEPSLVGSPRNACQPCDDIANAGTLYIDHQLGVGVDNMPSACQPFFSRTSSLGDLWTRQIIIKAPSGSTLLQHNRGSQLELIWAPALLSAFSALTVFGAQGWALSMINCATHSQATPPIASNHVESNPNSLQYFFQLRKSGTTEELAISKSIQTALDKFCGLTGWIPLY